MSQSQVSDFILEHRDTVREFDFDNVTLANGGVWEDALAPLSGERGSDEWFSQGTGSDLSSKPSFDSQPDPAHLEEYEEVIGSLPNTGRTSIRLTRVRPKRAHHRRRRKHKDTTGRLKISAPIPINGPIEVVLQAGSLESTVQGVQRNMAQEVARQELAEDPDKQVSALKKAKAAVLRQLGKEFRRTQAQKEHVKDFLKQACSNEVNPRRRFGHENNSALVPLIFSRY